MEKEYLYKIGDIVRIREGLDSNGTYRMKSGPMDGYSLGINKSMTRRGGEIHMILGYTNCNCYHIDDDEPLGQVWTDKYSWVWHGFEVTDKLLSIYLMSYMKTKENNNV